MATLDLCEKFFDTRDIYKLFDLAKDALPKEVKRAYYKLSLQVHPDRVAAKEKDLATEKFKVLSKLYQVLSDSEKRALYDEQGVIDEDQDDMEGKLFTWLELWRKIFKPLTTEDISNYEKSYVNSELERNDIRKAYLSGKGCINMLMNEVPFLKVEDEPRLQKIVREMIDANEVPDYPTFTKEPAQKRNRRHKKYARESNEANEIKAKMAGSKNLEQQLMERQQSRESNYNSLMDKLMEKYGGEDDSDVIDFSAIGKKKSKKKKITTSKRSKDQDSTTSQLNRVQNGRVKKRKN